MGRGRLKGLAERYRVTAGAGFSLRDRDAGDSAPDLVDRDARDALLADGLARLAVQAELLYPQDPHAVLAVFQGMDASGKDGTIKHVLSGVDPQMIEVSSFKVPGPEELAHGFLWRVTRQLPRRGHIGVFNRSHYEDVLVTRVHPDRLARATLTEPVGPDFWRHRLDDIAAFERYLARQGTVILKFFLHISRAEQKRRLLERMEDPAKNWKFSPADIEERAYWKDYIAAYEAAIGATAAPHAPWFIVPADHKWFARLVVMEVLVDALEALAMKPTEPTEAERGRLRAARRKLEAE